MTRFAAEFRAAAFLHCISPCLPLDHPLSVSVKLEHLPLSGMRTAGYASRSRLTPLTALGGVLSVSMCALSIWSFGVAERNRHKLTSPMSKQIALPLWAKSSSSKVLAKQAELSMSTPISSVSIAENATIQYTRQELADAERILLEALQAVKDSCNEGKNSKPRGIGKEFPDPPKEIVVQMSKLWTQAVESYDVKIEQLGKKTTAATLPLAQPRFVPHEFSCFSQNTEDGILLYIFAKIRAQTKRAVEACSGVGHENNIANLAVMHGWETVMIDGDPQNSRHAHLYFSQDKMPTTMSKPRFINSRITAENINDLISGQGFGGEIDLFSLDMDGMDYWIWRALTVVQPRVVVVEIQELWGPREVKTRPYRADFVASGIPTMGASIGAFSKLAASKGYRLIGCMGLGFNAFYMKNGTAEAEFPAYEPEGCFVHHKGKWAQVIAERKAQAMQYDWVDV